MTDERIKKLNVSKTGMKFGVPIKINKIRLSCWYG